jgi:hypothetical protein
VQWRHPLTSNLISSHVQENVPSVALPSSLSSEFRSVRIVCPVCVRGGDGVFLPLGAAVTQKRELVVVVPLSSPALVIFVWGFFVLRMLNSSARRHCSGTLEALGHARLQEFVNRTEPLHRGNAVLSAHAMLGLLNVTSPCNGITHCICYKS